MQYVLLPISSDTDCAIESAQPVDTAARIGAYSDDVSQANDTVNVLRVDIVECRIQRREEALNIAEDGNFRARSPPLACDGRALTS